MGRYKLITNLQVKGLIVLVISLLVIIFYCGNAVGFNNSRYSSNEEPDDDNDGIPNWWEEHWALYAEKNNLTPIMDPNNPSDAEEDWDADFLKNYDEYLRGTNPYSFDPGPEIVPPVKDNGSITDQDKDYSLFLILGIIIVVLLILLAIIATIKLFGSGEK
ncbi:hypothetical protein [[Eubacterium] cellulosolvens]